MTGGSALAGSADRAVFFSGVGWIGTGDPVFGAFPRHAQAAENHPNGFGADQARGEALDETDLDGESERPPAGGLAKRPKTLIQQRPQNLAGPSIEDGRQD